MLYSVCVCRSGVGVGGVLSPSTHTPASQWENQLLADSLIFSVISYSLLLSEHTEIQHFGLASPLSPSPPCTPLFPTTVRNNQLCFSSCTWFVHKPYFEYDACKSRCLNQTYEDTNLHLLSVWRGLPYRNEGPGFPIQLKASQVQVANDKNWIKFLVFFGGGGGCFGILVLFWTLSLPTTPHYCVFCVLAAAAITAGVSDKSKTSTVSESEGDWGLIFTFSFTMYSSMVLT